MTPQLGRDAAGRRPRPSPLRSVAVPVLIAVTSATWLLGCSAGTGGANGSGPVPPGVSGPGAPDEAMTAAPDAPSDAPSVTPTDALVPPPSSPGSVPTSPTVSVRLGDQKAARAPASSRAAAARTSAARSSAAARSSSASPAAALAQAKTAAAGTSPSAVTGFVLLLGPATESAAEAGVVRLVNVQRAAAGCDPMTVDSTLVQLARAHSRDMAGAAGFRHNGSDGRTPFQRMNAAGYDYSMAAENIAAGQTTAAAVMAAWMTSPGRQANILDCRFTELGVGMVNRPGTQYGVYWTQDVGTPM
jgi:uncharacterized protein YkwD